MKMSESAEDYLETILILQGQKPHVRSSDIVSYLDFSKPSVSTAMKRLRENGLILMDEDGYITLTKSGREIAEKIYERHLVIAEIFHSLGVPEEIALKDACKIEHDISEISFQRMKSHYLERKKSQLALEK